VSGRQWIGSLSSLMLALVLTLMLWFVATERERQLVTVDVYPRNGPLPVALIGAPEGRSPYDPSVRETTVTLRGFGDAIAALDPARDIRLAADLGQATPQATTHAALVQVMCARCARLGVRVMAVADSRVEVRLGRTVTETRSVHVDWPGAAPSGHVITRQSATPAQVRLWGAEDAVRRVQRLVAVTAEPEQLQDVMRFEDVPVIPVDDEGLRVLDVIVRPDRVEAELHARRRGIEVSVRPELTGVEADGYYITGVAIEPQTLQLEGPADELRAVEAAGSLRVPVAIDGEAGDIVRRVAVGDLLPPGVSAINAPEGVTVTVNLTPLPGTRTMEAAVTTRNLGEALSVQSLAPARVDVLISGPRAELALLRPDSLTVSADLAGLGPGRHTVRLGVDAPAGYLPRSTTPGTVEVVLVAGARATAAPGR